VKITAVETHVLVDPDYDVDATSSAQDDLVVEIKTDEGLTGIGETDVNPWIGAACLSAPGTHTMGQNLTDMLIGADPLDPAAIWDRLYTGSAMNGRRGVVVNVIGALDIAVHDLAGQYLGKPVHALLGEQVTEVVRPYASLQPETSDFDSYKASLVRWALKAQRMGFHAAKLEVTFSGPYAHMGLREPWSRATEVIGAVRAAVGPSFGLMVDVQYAFPDADSCLATIRDWQQFDLLFIETPVPSDDLLALARVTTEQPIPIAVGEWLTTRFEFIDLIEQGKVQIVQPDIGRVGGFTEAIRVCGLAQTKGLTVIPHLWKTGISVAAAVHLAAVTPHCPWIEFLPVELSESSLRHRLLAKEPVLSEGVVRVSNEPGLGITIDREAMERFEEAARRLHQW
jgi:L-alanine-DL-glutamate epimerase-like enolase superfamily enzyme